MSPQNLVCLLYGIWYILIYTIIICIHDLSPFKTVNALGLGYVLYAFF